MSSYESHPNDGRLYTSPWLLTIIPMISTHFHIMSPYSYLHGPTSVLEIRRSFGALSWTPSKVDPALLGGPAPPATAAATGATGASWIIMLHPWMPRGGPNMTPLNHIALRFPGAIPRCRE